MRSNRRPDGSPHERGLSAVPTAMTRTGPDGRAELGLRPNSIGYPHPTGCVAFASAPCQALVDLRRRTGEATALARYCWSAEGRHR